MSRITTYHPTGLIPWIVIFIGAIALVAVAVRGEETPPTTPEDLMRVKLVHAQQTLEGLAVGNFEQIARNAEQLEVLSHDVGWIVLQTKEYRTYSEQFRRDAERLRTAASRRNLDAAGLAYVQLTLTCINCHQHVREERRRLGE